jgi:hypothetical protein
MQSLIIINLLLLFLTFIVASVITPKVPSDPIIKLLRSGPDDILGVIVDLVYVPIGVTILLH